MSLRPMFSYFGSKYKLSPLYSSPELDTIIEPFAGSAAYALKYPDKRVFLYDLDERIVSLWQYLIKAKESEILSLPIPPWECPYIGNYDICEEAKILIGFWIVEQQTYPSKRFAGRYLRRPSRWNENSRFLVASQLKFIRHWKASLKSYTDLDNIKATYFIDPPYMASGKRYRYGSRYLDYNALGQWCRSRNGHVIVCEGHPWKSARPEWLPFDYIYIHSNANNRACGEMVYEQWPS